MSPTPRLLRQQAVPQRRREPRDVRVPGHHVVAARGLLRRVGQKIVEPPEGGLARRRVKVQGRSGREGVTLGGRAASALRRAVSAFGVAWSRLFDTRVWGLGAGQASPA